MVEASGADGCVELSRGVESLGVGPRRRPPPSASLAQADPDWHGPPPPPTPSINRVKAHAAVLEAGISTVQDSYPSPGPPQRDVLTFILSSSYCTFPYNWTKVDLNLGHNCAEFVLKLDQSWTLDLNWDKLDWSWIKLGKNWINTGIKLV